MPRWRRLEAVLFDLDDTLANERDAVQSALNEAVRNVVHSPTIDGPAVHASLKSLFTTEDQPSFPDWVLLSTRPEPWSAALRNCGVEDPEAGKELHRQLHDGFIERISLSEGARETLERVGARYALALMTNGPAPLRRAELDHLGITDYFEAIVISSEVGFTKPDPQFFMQALVDFGCRAGDAVMVGDDPFEDVIGAKATGLKSVWFNPRVASLPDDTPAPDVEIRLLSELPEQLGM
jgi:HAD superfamily hydrolase (TIGR01509 family)